MTSKDKLIEISGIVIGGIIGFIGTVIGMAVFSGIIICFMQLIWLGSIDWYLTGFIVCLIILYQSMNWYFINKKVNLLQKQIEMIIDLFKKLVDKS